MSPGSKARLPPHPTRDKIVAALRASPEPLSSSRLARIIGATVGATAYHVHALERVGVIELVREGRDGPGAVENFFALRADSADAPLIDHAFHLLMACDALTAERPDGTLTGVAIDHALRIDLDNVLAAIKPSVDAAVGKWLARAHRQR
jgi:DNA-binding transcriptional ArsR family regulator